MKRMTTIPVTGPNRTKPRLIAGVCCLLLAVVQVNARREQKQHLRTTVELRVSEQWTPGCRPTTWNDPERSRKCQEDRCSWW